MDKNIRDMVAADIADDKLEDYQPYPAGVNDGPFMSYESVGYHYVCSYIHDIEIK